MAQQAILSFVAVGLFVIGIAGNGFEMRRIRMSTKEDELTSKNVFLDKRNFKWYGLIGLSLIIWELSNVY